MYGRGVELIVLGYTAIRLNSSMLVCAEGAGYATTEEALRLAEAKEKESKGLLLYTHLV